MKYKCVWSNVISWENTGKVYQRRKETNGETYCELSKASSYSILIRKINKKCIVLQIIDDPHRHPKSETGSAPASEMQIRIRNANQDPHPHPHSPSGGRFRATIYSTGIPKQFIKLHSE